MPEERAPIPSPGTAAGRSLTAGSLSAAGGIGALWASLEIEITGSGLALGVVAAAEISGLAAFGIIGGTLALAAAPVLLTLGGIALLSGGDEQILHDVAASAAAVTEFTSPSTLALIAMTSPFADRLPWSGFPDPFAGQSLAGGAIDFGIGIFTGSPQERLLAATAFGAQAPDAVKQFQDLRDYLSQSGSQSGTPGPLPTPAPGPRPLPESSPSTSPFIQAAPGMSDLDIQIQESLFPDDLTGPGLLTQLLGGTSINFFGFDMGASDAGRSPSSDSMQNVTTSIDSQPSDCASDCNHDCDTDCTHDCTHDCSSDCTHDCQCQCDCECDEC